MAKKTSRESREEILKYRFRGIEPIDTLPRTIGKLRHALRPKKNKKRDDCAKHDVVEKEVTASWFGEPGSADVKGIDIPSSIVHEHFRVRPTTGQKDVKVRRHYRLKKKFPDFCKKK